MGIYLNPGIGKFKRAINSEIYVDKTGIIEQTNKVLNTEQGFLCISRPRRFGKSMTANMIAAYYGKGQDSSSIFDNFKVAKTEGYKIHMNQYNVIFLNMQNFLSERSNINDMLEYLQKKVISELSKSYKEIDVEENSLANCLEEIFADTGEMFVFVIDEWDCLLREKKYDVDAQKAYLDFIRNLLKDRGYVALAYMTGILPVKKYGTHSALNMMYEYSMTNTGAFSEYVGFTEIEVRELCQRYNMNFEEMKNWYDGYVLPNVGHIYNPRSVIEALTRKKFGSYWTRTETYEALKIFLEMNFDGLRDCIIQMMSGAEVVINTEKFQNDMSTFKSKDDVMTLLVHLGYLAYNQDKSSVYIPNYEVQSEFGNSIEGEYWADVIELIQNSDELLKATWNGEASKVAQMIDKVHMNNTSILSYNNENALACVISMAYYNAVNYYTRVREFPSGRGFADVVFIPKKTTDKPAMVIELKYDKSTKGAISQIKEKHYLESLKEYQGNILLVGINYDKKTGLHECEVDYN